MDGRMDGVKPIYPPTTTLLCGGYNYYNCQCPGSWKRQGTGNTLGWRALKTPTAETPGFYGHVTTLTLQYLWPRPPGVWLGGPGCKPGHSGWPWWSPTIKIASGLIPVMNDNYWPSLPRIRQALHQLRGKEFKNLLHRWSKHKLHGLVDFDEWPTSTPGVKVGNPMDDHVMEEQWLTVDFDDTGQQASKIVHISARKIICQLIFWIKI